MKEDAWWARLHTFKLLLIKICKNGQVKGHFPTILMPKIV